MLKLEFQLEKYINFDLIIICSRYNKNGKAFSIMGCAKNDRSYKLIRFDNIIIVSIATKTKSKFAWQQQFFFWIMRLSTVARSLKNVRSMLLLGAKQQKNIAFHVQFHGGLPTCCSKTNSNFFERATYRRAVGIGPMFNFHPKYFMGFFALCSNNVKPSYTWCQSV